MEHFFFLHKSKQEYITNKHSTVYVAPLFYKYQLTITVTLSSSTGFRLDFVYIFQISDFICIKINVSMCYFKNHVIISYIEFDSSSFQNIR